MHDLLELMLCSDKKNPHIHVTRIYTSFFLNILFLKNLSMGTYLQIYLAGTGSINSLNKCCKV